MSTQTPTEHDGRLSGNTRVIYEDDAHIDSNTLETFYIRSVILYDPMRHFALIPREALRLLDWLEQEKETLEQLVKTENASVVGDD